MGTSSETSISVSQKEGREKPEERFRRVATRRTKQVLKYLRLLGNTANVGYKHTEGEADAIFSALRKALAETEGKFANVEEENFTL